MRIYHSSLSRERHFSHLLTKPMILQNGDLCQIWGFTLNCNWAIRLGSDFALFHIKDKLHDTGFFFKDRGFTAVVQNCPSFYQALD